MRNPLSCTLSFLVGLFVLAGVCGCMDGGFADSILNLELDDPGGASGGDGSGSGSGDVTGSGSVVDSEPPTSDGPTGDGGSADQVTAPDNDYCAAVEGWDASWAEFEQQVVELVNHRRGEGAVCGGTEFAPAGPLQVEGSLRCAARNHTQDMAVRDFFDHTNPDGDGPGQRIEYAEYDGRGWGENIAYGYSSPESVVAGWMDSPGHCSNIMNASFTQTGVGYYDGSQWVQVFGTPR